MIWKPNLTVAALVEHQGKFLMVEEESQKGPVINQPAGHLEPNESLYDAAIRETLEESGYHFTPMSIIGSYLWHNPDNNTTYFRTTFSGNVLFDNINPHLDTGIIQALWMTRDEIIASRARLRSPVIIDSINDYLAGKTYPLDLIKYCPSSNPR